MWDGTRHLRDEVPCEARGRTLRREISKDGWTHWTLLAELFSPYSSSFCVCSSTELLEKNRPFRPKRPGKTLTRYSSGTDVLDTCGFRTGLGLPYSLKDTRSRKSALQL
jgi:hypothetical protein